MNIIEVAYNWTQKLEKRESTHFIVVHHAQAKTCTVQDIDQWHKNNGWSGIGYAFLIKKDGTIYRGRPEWAQGAHCKGYNHNSIGICLEGDFTTENPTSLQLASLVELSRYLISLYPNARIVRHKDLNDTECPGQNLPNSVLIDAMNPPQKIETHWAEEYFNYLNEHGVEVKEQRFEDNLSRGECFALMTRLYKALKG